MRRDREDELYLTHVGRETHTATHSAEDGVTNRRLKRSLDDLVGAGEDRWWDGEAERLGCL
jgi:hypothetical protein